MEIDLEIYSHFVKTGVLEGGFNRPEHKVFLDTRKVMLDDETSVLFENGIVIARYMIYIKRKLEALQDEQQSRVHYKIDESVLAQLRPQVTPSIRLHNWNILIKEIMKLGIKVNADMKSLLVAGDYGIILDYLLQLRNFELVQTGEMEENNNTFSSLRKSQDNSIHQTQGGGEQPIDIGEVDLSKRPNETITCLEFLINILCKAFSMAPPQAAGLLTNANKYLNIAIIKGLKGEFEPVICFYQETYQYCKHLTNLIEHETNFNLSNNTLFLILNAYKGGFLSQNEDVVNWCCRLFAKIAFEFWEAGEMIGQAWDWFKDENQGAIETCVQALDKHQNVIEAMVQVFVNFGRYNFTELFTHHIKKYASISSDYLNLIHEMIGPIHDSKFSRDELINSGTLDYLIEHCILKADPSTGGMDTTKNDKQASLCLLCTMWIMFADKFDKEIEIYDETSSKARIFQHLKSSQIVDKQTYATVSLTVLKRGCRDKSQTVKVLRHHLMTNFQYIFERSNTIPIGILIEPLVKQILITESVTFNFNVFDFDFFSSLARHSRLNIKNAVQIADLMAKSYLNENAIEFQNSAGVPLMLVVTRFLDHEAIQEFLVKFVSISIDTMTLLEKSINAKNAERREKINEFEKALEEEKKKRPQKRKWPPEKTIAEQFKPPQETSEEIEERAKQLIRRHRCIDIIKQLVQYRNQDLNDEIKNLLLSSLLKFTEENQVESKSICHILDWWWGKPQTLLQEYIEKKKLEEAKMHQDLLAIEYQGIQMNEEDLQMDDRASSDFYNNSETRRSEEQQSKVGKQPYSIMIKDIVRNQQPVTQQISKQQTKISSNQVQKQVPQTQQITQHNEMKMSKTNEQKTVNEQKMSVLSENKPPRQHKPNRDKKSEKEQPLQINEFLNIIQNSKQEKPEALKKKQQEPVRHKFDEIQQIMNQNEQQPHKKPSHQRNNIQVFDPTFTENASSIQYQSQIKPPQSTKNQPQIKHFQENQVKKPQQENTMDKQFKMLQESLMNQRNFSLPQLNQQANIANYQSAHVMKRTKRDLSHQNQNSGSKELVSQKHKPKSQLAHLESPQSQLTLDENMYKMLQYQQMLLQQNLKNSKSHAVLNQSQENRLVPVQQKRLVDVPVLRKQPKDKRVLEDIQKINQKKIEKEYKKYIDEQIKQYKDQKQRRSIKQELERRKLELGIAASKDRRNPFVKEAVNAAMGRSLDDSYDGSTERIRGKQILDVVILDEGEELPQHKQKIRKLLPPMQLVDINTEEEERDRIDIMLWLQKFNKLFKTLFQKYVSTIRSAMEQTFEGKDQRGKLLNFAETLKFCKDHGIYPDYLSKDEIQSLLRMLSLKRNKKEEVMYLDMESFQNFFIQCSYYIFNFKENKKHLSLLQQMEELLKVMQKTLLYKGENIGLYEDPDYVVGLDKQRLKELNQQLQQDPLMEIPLGFYKVYEKKMHYEYTLPDYLPIKESERIAAEVLDGFLNDIFGVHTLEARGFPVVVPRIKQHENIQVGRHYKNLNEIKENSRWFSPPQSQQTQVRRIFGRNFSPKRDESMISYQLMDQKKEEFKSIDSKKEEFKSIDYKKEEQQPIEAKEEPKQEPEKKYLKIKKEKKPMSRKNSSEMVNKYINPKMKYEDALEVAQCIGDMLDKLDPPIVEEDKSEYSLREIEETPQKPEKEITLQKLDSIVKQSEPLNQTKDNSELMQKQLELSKLYKEHSQYQQSQQPMPLRPQIMNRIQAEKIKKKLEDEKKEFEREVKRLQQEKELKQKMTEIHQLREEQVYDQTKQQKQTELIELERKKREEEKRKREFDEKKKAVQEKKLKDLEELQRQKEMENERKRKESELRAIKQKEFLKNQKDKLKKEFDTKINERKELAKEQEQFKQTEEQLKNEIKSNMVNYIQKTKEDLKQIEERQKREVNEFFQAQDTKALFKRYERGLKQYYKFYAAQDKQQIEFNLEAKNDTINMNEFVKFGYQSNIYPALITHEDLLQIFRQLVRERYDAKNQSQEEKDKMFAFEVEMLHVIDFDYFKKGLIRIAAMAQDRLLSGNPSQATQQPKGQSRTQSRAFSRRTNRSISSSLNVSTVGSLVRKTRENYLIKQLQEKTPKYGTKIEDKQITKPLKMDSMNHKILEHLLQFLDINEIDNATKVTSKIHNKRIELAGQKPSKVKKEEVKKLAQGSTAILQEDQGDEPVNQEEVNQEENVENQE